MLEQNAIYCGFLMRYKRGSETLHQLQRTVDIHVSKHVLFCLKQRTQYSNGVMLHHLWSCSNKRSRLEVTAKILLNTHTHKKPHWADRQNVPGNKFIKTFKKSAWKGQKIPKEASQSHMPVKQMILIVTQWESKCWGDFSFFSAWQNFCYFSYSKNAAQYQSKYSTFVGQNWNANFEKLSIIFITLSN